MIVYNPDIHHRRSIRLRGYDYSSDGAYFVTICTQNKLCLLGNVINGEMAINETGKITEQCWLQIPIHFPIAKLNAFIIMPNHLHGIIELCDDQNIVEANNYSPIRARGTSLTIGSIVRGFKIGVTKLIGRSIWQRSYYEHIIRDDEDYYHIEEYIRNNPINWQNDKLYNAHVGANNYSPNNHSSKYHGDNLKTEKLKNVKHRCE